MEDLRAGGFFNMDCMQAMEQFEDGFFDLAIVDPPYGIGVSRNPIRQRYRKKDWDNEKPSNEYFRELFRVSKNQIVWGAITTICLLLKIISCGTRCSQRV